MKTLDEVIFEAPYSPTPWEADAIHYLREYKIKRNMIFTRIQACDNREKRLQEEIALYQEAVKNCEAAESKYRQLAQDLREVGNPPLTWDELRTMVGKPVWIDSVPLVRRWVIIKKFHPIGGNKNLFDMEVEDGAHFLRKNMRRDDGAWWQAYRKEQPQ